MPKIVQITGQENLSNKFNKRYFRAMLSFSIVILETRARMESVRVGETLGHTANKQQGRDYNTGLLIPRPTPPQLQCFSGQILCHFIELDLWIHKQLLFPQQIPKPNHLDNNLSWTIIIVTQIEIISALIIWFLNQNHSISEMASSQCSQVMFFIKLQLTWKPKTFLKSHFCWTLWAESTLRNTFQIFNV